jgi:unconventional prefoldin RPB5 interactor 1
MMGTFACKPPEERARLKAREAYAQRLRDEMVAAERRRELRDEVEWRRVATAVAEQRHVERKAAKAVWLAKLQRRRLAPERDYLQGAALGRELLQREQASRTDLDALDTRLAHALAAKLAVQKAAARRVAELHRVEAAAEQRCMEREAAKAFWRAEDELRAEETRRAEEEEWRQRWCEEVEGAQVMVVARDGEDPRRAEERHTADDEWRGQEVEAAVQRSTERGGAKAARRADEKRRAEEKRREEREAAEQRRTEREAAKAARLAEDQTRAEERRRAAEERRAEEERRTQAKAAEAARHAREWSMARAYCPAQDQRARLGLLLPPLPKPPSTAPSTAPGQSAAARKVAAA